MNAFGYLVDGNYFLYPLFDSLSYLVIVLFLLGMLLDDVSTSESFNSTTCF